MRAFYVSLVFYFVPFAVLLGQWVAPLKLKKNQLGHTSSENKLTLPTPGEAEPAPDFWTMWWKVKDSELIWIFVITK